MPTEVYAWEPLPNDPENTTRLRIPGGWLYRVVTEQWIEGLERGEGTQFSNVSVIFVPLAAVQHDQHFQLGRERGEVGAGRRPFGDDPYRSDR